MSVITAIIKCNGTELDLPHILLGIDVNWEVNRIPYAQLILVEGSSATRKFPLSDAAVFSPGNTVEILLREEGKQGITTSIFKGLVVRHALESEGVESVLRVELKDSAYKMTIARKSAVHQGTDKDILTKLIKAANLDADIEGGSDLTHPEMVQYYCTDWDFMLSRAEAQNLVVAVRDGKVSARPLMVKALYDNSRTHSFMYGIDPMYRFEMEADAENQYGEIESNFWIYNNGTKKGESMSTEKPNTNSFLDDDNLGAEEIKKSKPSSDGEKISLTSAVPMDSQEAKSWADSRVARSYMSLLRGSISVPGIADIMLLDLMEIAGLGNRFKGKTLVTGFRHQVDENGWQTHVQFGLPAEPFAQSPNISVDYAVMEKAPHAAVIEADLSWSDLGSFLALDTIATPDKQGNVCRLMDGAEATMLDARDCVVYAEGERTVALLGTHDLVCVAVDDAVLVCPKHRIDDMKSLVQKLRDERRENLL